MTITTDTTLLHDPRRQAALLYWQGFSVPQIAAMLQMKRPTVQSWKQRDGWDSVAPISRVEMSLEARLTQLIIKPQKTGGDFKEIDLLGRQIERLARVNRYSQTGNEADLNPNVANRNKGGRRKPKKNFFSDEAIEKLEQIFFEQSFDYQLHWYRAGLEHRIRDILKSRQIGATFYFSREALLRALKTGHNQIFLSASKTQAYVFREYIIAFARLVDVDLTGDPIVLGNNGAKLIFLGTNSNTAQSHNGDLYVDEIFWIPNFQVLRKVASGNAFLEKRYSTTGKVIRLETSPAKYTRRGVEEDVYWWVPSFNEPTAFAPGSVFHLLEPDINQELYGLPEYLSALNSAWLNESATLFRRKYYENGAHAGYIMYVTDAVQDRNDIEMLRENMMKSKGRNNFKNLFLYAPQGKADGIKIIPLSEVATKDDFFNIKKASAADLLDAHRIPFQLMGGKPENVGSLGDIEKVAKVFVRNELIPLQDRIREINGWLGQEVIRFKNYSLDTDNG